MSLLQKSGWRGLHLWVLVIGKETPSFDGSMSPQRKDRNPHRAPQPDRVITLAGLLTCGSGLCWAFPCFHSGICQHRSPLTVAGAVAELTEYLTAFPFHRT